MFAIADCAFYVAVLAMIGREALTVTTTLTINFLRKPAATDLRAIILRYFNPIGSDPDLESGIYAREPSHVLGQLVMAAQAASALAGTA